ncbi:MAG: LamG domain-containing protein, partial [Gammaproteobacteria bacterium]
IMRRALVWAAGATTVTTPIAHWKLDEGSGPTAVDSVGGNDATLNGGSSWTTGTLDGALDFDGSGDYATTDNNFTPPPVGTVTFWMQVSGSPGSHGRILGLDDTWEIRHVTTGTPDGIPYGLVFDLGLSGVNTEFVTTTTIDVPGRWYHIAAAYDTNNDAYAVYIDGLPHKSGTYPTALAVPAANPLSLGTRTGSTNYFDGVLDDVRIYDRFLSADDIADLAAEGGYSGPVAHWKLDDGVGSNAIDSVGGHDGTVSGASWTAGQDGDALQFDGSNDYVDLTSDAELDDVFVGGATVMAWIEPAGWGENGYGRIFDKSSSPSSTNDGWALRMSTDNGGIINFGQGFTGGRGWWKIPNGSISLNTWQHVAVAYDASSTTNDPVIYLDGSPLAVTEVDSPSGSVRSDASINLRLGNYAGATSHTFDGKIDDARVYDRMLSAAEIASIAGGGGGGGGPTTTFEVRVGTSSDDAEERVSNGNVNLTSSDLELISDGSNAQLVGMRFTNVTVPNGATIANAYVQFQVDETNSGGTNVNVQGQAIDDAPTFTSSNSNISSRSLTTATVPWAPVPWTTVGDAGTDQQTPDIAAVIQEIVNRPGWTSGNDIVIIVTGSGERTAESQNGVSAAAPLLHIEY